MIPNDSNRDSKEFEDCLPQDVFFAARVPYMKQTYLDLAETAT